MSYNEWREVELNSVAEFYNGKKRPDTKGHIPVFGGNGVLDYCDSFNADDENIIIGRVGAYCGNVNYYKGLCWISDNAILVKSKEGINSKYIYYCLINKKLNNLQIGSSQPLLTQGILKNIQINLPPLHEQKAIAKILSDLDEKIEINNRINKVLEEIAQTIFKRWFIDFEFPNENGEPYKSSGGEMVNSELGPIPKGWKVGRLGDIGEFKNGINYNRKEEGNKTYGIVNVRDIVKEAFITKTNMDNVIIDSEKANQYLLNKGDILIVRSAAPGKVGILLKEESDIIYSGFIILFRLFDYKYIYFMFMMLKDLDKRLDTYANGTTLKNINQQILKNIKIILPDDKIVEMFNNIVIQFFDKIIFIKEENQNLSQLRDALLPKLMSGEIRVDLNNDQIVLKNED